jgi:hypothetical protein
MSVQSWLYGILTGNATLTALHGNRVYEGSAPQGVVFPVVIFNYMAGRDVTLVEGTRSHTSSLWLVKVVDKAETFTSTATITSQIDALLHAKKETMDGINYSCLREEPFFLIEETDGVEYRHQGGMYRVLS